MKLLLQATLMVLVFTVLTGIAYPLAITAIAATTATINAAGDPMLIGHAVTDPRYFWSRPSAAAYDAKASTGSNLGPMSAALLDNVRVRIEALHAAGDEGPPPVALVTASASGLDPHISPEAARYQAARIARLRGLPRATLDALIDATTEHRTFGLLGEPRVNVAALNTQLDNVSGVHQ